MHNKNLTKIDYKTPSGIKIFKLYDDDLGELKPVTEYLQTLSRKNPPKSTIDNKGADVTRFFSYLLAFDQSFFQHNNIHSTNSVTLREIIFQYPEYLTTPLERCSGIFAKYASEKLMAKPLAKSSASRHLSTINEFLTTSALFHESLEDLKKKELVDIDTDENVFASLFERRELTWTERNCICKRSVIAGVISGGVKYAKSVVFKAPRVANRQAKRNFVEKAFPVKSVLSLVSKENDLRNKMLWCILAGTGIRISEALQILVTDIDIPNELIFVLDPADRKHLFYGVDDSKFERASYKGRSSPTTYFINPFRDIFFDNLQEYLDYRWSLNPNNQCLFVSTSSSSKGNSLIGSKELNAPFKASPYNIQSHTLHSLRHFYGVWCRNFIKRGNNKYGFPVATVMKMMGHSYEGSTDIYAIKDNLLLQAEIQFANELLAGCSIEDVENNVSTALKYRLSVIQERILGISK